MLRLTELKLPLGHPPDAVTAAAAPNALGVPAAEIIDCRVVRRGHDARRRSAIQMVYSVDVSLRSEAQVLSRFAGDGRVTRAPDTTYRFLARATGRELRRPVVVGAGPCGLFAGLLLAQMGFRPIILDRGKVVRQRTKDTLGPLAKGRPRSESNVQFGEGGAGTFSDGKLYSQIKDSAISAARCPTEFVAAGAPPEILTDAHPHIGTFRLVTMVERLRTAIERLGGEYRFRNKVTDLVLGGRGQLRRVRGVLLESGEILETVMLSYSRHRPPRARHLPPALRPRCPHRSQAVFPEASVSSIPSPSSTKPASGPAPTVHPDLGRRTEAGSRTHAPTDGRSTASACVLAGRWSRPRRNPGGW